jgi:glycosyltransferase involved in cell wall biosynthesis
MRKTIPAECTWVIVYDSKVTNPPDIEGAVNLHSPDTGYFGNPNRNFALETLKDHLNDEDWLYILDDDNIIHEKWYDGVKDHLGKCSMLHWSQAFPNNSIRAQAADVPVCGKVDTAQYMVRWSAAKNIRYRLVYEADGFYAEDCYHAAGGSTKLNDALCYYNYLRPNKSGNALWSHICMISMFKNEAKNIRRMLDSVTPYIDYWVLQDNGSTDGTPEVVEQWAKETRIPGKLYKVEEGWVNFGWNRDHLLQVALNEQHGCDWIMKMDCDETLEVDPSFDWKPFWDIKEHKPKSFHVPSILPGLIYYRAWIWDANLPWKFNHDPAHETIYLNDGVTGENFERTNLPTTFKMVAGQSYGESYTVPTKYVTDALKLEEKLIRENTMLTDLYHFWYIGKSYEDCYRGDFFPLKDVHQSEYARRVIFYFTQVVTVKHGGLVPTGIDEMAYYALCGAGNAYRFLKEYDKAIELYEAAIPFAPGRNDHLIYLAEIHWELRDFKRMLQYTTQMMDAARVNPFPNYYFLINTNMYNDTGTYCKVLHDIAIGGTQAIQLESVFVAKRKPRKMLWVVDDFYDDPNLVRQFALQQQFEDHSDWYKGRRTYERWHMPSVRHQFEQIMGQKIIRWDEHGMNGKFQYCVPENPLVYHYDTQQWAALIYLTPDAPFSSGTALYAHKESRIRHMEDHPNADRCFDGGFYDSSKFELVDYVGNVFNRLVIFNARSFHAATQYFGTDINNSRLFQIFFFD